MQSVLSRHCLDQRIPDQDRLRRETTARMQQRNTTNAMVKQRFTIADARSILKKQYPTLKSSE